MAYEVIIPPEVQQALEQLAPNARLRVRRRLQRKLGELARLAALRNWAVLDDTAGLLPVELTVRTDGRFSGTYAINHAARTLTLLSLLRLGGAPRALPSGVRRTG